MDFVYNCLFSGSASRPELYEVCIFSACLWVGLDTAPHWLFTFVSPHI